MKFEGPLAIFTLYLVPAALATAIIFVFFRRNLDLKWYWWEALCLLIPGIVYCLIDWVNIGKSKSLGNLVEPIIIGVAYAVAIVIRAKLGSIYFDRNFLFAIVVPIFITILAVSIYFLMPSLPE